MARRGRTPLAAFTIAEVDDDEVDDSADPPMAMSNHEQADATEMGSDGITGGWEGTRRRMSLLPEGFSAGWTRRRSSIADSIRRFSDTLRLANRFKKVSIPIEEEIKRQFAFDPAALVKGASMTDVFKAEIHEEDFNDIVDQDDDRVESFVSQELVGQMVESEPFRFFILFVIVINAILIGLQTDKDISEANASIFSILDNLVLTIFICELLLKWYYDFFIYWRVSWNILDFVIILALILGPTLKFLGSSRSLRILRVFRAFRSLRSVSALAGLSIVVQTIFQSIPDMLNIGLLLVVIMVVLSVAGVALFGSELPQHFGNMGSAMFSLFICVTQDGWMGIFNDFKEKSGEEDVFFSVVGGIYFFICILIGAFVFANLVVAVMVTNLDKAMKEVKEEKKMQEDTLATKPSGDEGESSQDKDIPIISVGDVIKSVELSMQKPLHFGDLNKLTHEKLENFLLAITAIEENITHYKKMRVELDEIFNVIWELNLKAFEDDNFDSDDDDWFESRPSTAAGTTPLPPKSPSAIDNIGRRGDILSNLLSLEKDKGITSTGVSYMGNVIQQSALLIDQSRFGPMPSRRPSFINRARVAMKGNQEKKMSKVTPPPSPLPAS
ncbi:cation channel sperm-associated protein 4-like [Glandiceps talaboti]